MSLFKKDVEDVIKQSIKYFNLLPSERKVLIVSDILKLNEEDGKKMLPLLTAIRNDISKYDQSHIANRLFDMGMDRTYAELFVSNMIDQAPSLLYQLNAISKIPDAEFGEKFPAIVNGLFVERENPEKLMAMHGIQLQQLSAISDITSKSMNGLVRSDISEKKIIEICKESDLSDAKIDVIINTFKINSEFWRHMLVFSNTQDSYFSLQRLEQQNEQILRTLSKILETLKILSTGKTGNQEPYQ